MVKRFNYCAYCGNFRKMESEHIIPACEGGKQIIFACKYCNRTKGKMSLQEWLKTFPTEAPQHIYVPRFINASEEYIKMFRKTQENSMQKIF